MEECLEDPPRSGRSLKLDERELQATLDAEQSPCTSTTKFSVDRKAVRSHLQRLDFIHRSHVKIRTS
ncbi:hypothetical protein KIN20_035106 [Parelaphostrongylus tenuis]|uniref:Uncharacterized protein n=1 Tax=Parelaphostrongylus tenuis TaxID=148309 RepID=A0AAD5RDL2_PARTN|nr:hypothetical protein KIN20_035106 [Parelaphostrongylus tenuis]